MSEKDCADIYQTVEDFAVEQAANIAQLAAEARRLGLIPELPREVLEKLDIGGTIMDLVRLQLKHATSLANVLGPQGRNLEKLNAFSALIARGKLHTAISKTQDATLGQTVPFPLVVDNPIDRVQTCTVSLGKLYRSNGESRAFTSEPGPANNGLLGWTLTPHIKDVGPQELRSFKLEVPLPADDFFLKDADYETTALVKLAPVGTVTRHLLRIKIVG